MTMCCKNVTNQLTKSTPPQKKPNQYKTKNQNKQKNRNSKYEAINKLYLVQPIVLICAYKPNIWEVKARDYPQLQGQRGLESENLFQQDQ